MTPAAVAAAGHFIAVFALVAALALEWAWLRGRVDRIALERLARADALYGLSALAVIGFGLLRVFVLEKPAAYYAHAVPFWLKLALFAAIGLLSIGPTLALLRARKTARADAGFVMPAAQVDALRRRVALELGLLVPLIVCASLMAKGVGLVA